MKLTEFIPYILTLLSLLWGFWQYKLNQKSKKQEVKYQTYLKISESLNNYSKQFELLLISLDVNKIKKTNEILKVIDPIIEQLSLRQKEITKKTFLTSKELSDFELRIDDIKSNNESSESLNEDFFQFRKQIKLTEIELQEVSDLLPNSGRV